MRTQNNPDCAPLPAWRETNCLRHAGLAPKPAAAFEAEYAGHVFEVSR